MTTDALRGLLPCPFCGDGAVLNSDNQVECALCCAIGPLGGGKDAQANIANWNRRAPASAQTSSDGEAGSSVKRTGYNPNPTPSRSEQGLATPDTTGTASAMVQGEVALVGNVAKPEDSTESKPWADHLPRPSDPTPAVAREALERIACHHVTENPLWWQVEARKALAALSNPETKAGAEEQVTGSYWDGDERIEGSIPAPSPPTTLDQLRQLTALQAEDEALWQGAKRVEPAYVKQALRYLTKAIEGEWSFEEARDAIREMMP